MLNASQGEHVVRNMFDLASTSFHENHFQAVPFVEVNVGRRQDVAMVVVLRVRDLSGKVGSVVVVDHRERSHDRKIVAHLFCNKRLANEVPEGLRAIAIASLVNEPVELFEEILLDGDSCPN